MNLSNDCFICSHPLLLHIQQRQKYWYCSHCREKFSLSFQQRINLTNRAERGGVRPAHRVLEETKGLERDMIAASR